MTEEAEKKKPKPKDWDKYLSDAERIYVLTYIETGNKSEAARKSGVAPHRAGATGSTMYNRRNVREAIDKLGGPKLGPPKIRVPRRSGAKKRASHVRDRALLKADETPLDVMVKTMNIAWKESERLRRSAKLKDDSETDDSFRKKLEACSIAKDAAPYIHPRLTAMEAKITNTVESMSDNELDAELERLLGDGSIDSALVGLMVQEDDGIPPVH